MKAWKPFKRDDKSISAILDIVFGFQRSRALLSACELDIFSTIGTGLRTVHEISADIDSDTQATERLLNALVSMELLEKAGNKYSNTQLSLRYLVRSKPEYMSVLNYYSYLWYKWGNLTETIKTGKCQTLTPIKDMNDKDVGEFLSAVHWRSKLLANDIAKLIDLSKSNNVLDLGGGLGDYAIEFSRMKSGLQSAVYTYPNVVPLTEKFLREEGQLENIKIISGDFRTDDIGYGYDLIFVSFVFHHYSIWENIELARKIYDALIPGGRIVVQDYLVSDDRTSPEFNVLKSLELLVNSENGTTYTESDIWIILREAWLKGIYREDTEFGTSLIFAHK